MPIANTISDVWCRFQEELLPALTEILGPLSDRHRKLVTVLEFATPEALLPAESRRAGRPREDRAALARSFIAKAVWNMPTTRDLLDRVHAEPFAVCAGGRAGRRYRARRRFRGRLRSLPTANSPQGCTRR